MRNFLLLDWRSNEILIDSVSGTYPEHFKSPNSIWDLLNTPVPIDEAIIIKKRNTFFIFLRRDKFSCYKRHMGKFYMFGRGPSHSFRYLGFNYVWWMSSSLFIYFIFIEGILDKTRQNRRGILWWRWLWGDIFSSSFPSTLIRYKFYVFD